jgi:subtilisin family serine protease
MSHNPILKIIFSILITLIFNQNLIAIEQKSNLVVVKLAEKHFKNFDSEKNIIKVNRNKAFSILSKYKRQIQLDSVSPMIEPKTLRLLKQKNIRIDKVTSDMERYFYWKFSDKQGVDLIKFLNAQPEIEMAYVAPKPVKTPAKDISPVTPKFRQSYLSNTGQGIGAKYANSQIGGAGQSVNIVDIEYSWARRHEDLSLKKSNIIQNYSPAEPITFNTDHGTAVAGIIAGIKNPYGIQGIAHKANFLMATPFDSEGLYSVASAIIAAVNATSEGDIILIEQQYYGPELECRCSPCDYYVPVEYYLADFDAIRAATLAGRIVIEAAGNGSQNLDSEIFDGIFSPDATSSLAIMVGAVKSRTLEGHCYSRWWRYRVNLYYNSYWIDCLRNFKGFGYQDPPIANLRIK